MMRRIIRNPWKPDPAGLLIREHMKLRRKSVKDIVKIVGGNPSERRRQLERGRFQMLPEKFGLLVKALRIDRDKAVRAGLDAGILSSGGTVAAKIRNARIMAGLSRHQLAKEAGVNIETLKRWETGNRNPSFHDRDKIGRALGQEIGTPRKVKQATTFQAKFIEAMKGDGTVADAAAVVGVKAGTINRLFSLSPTARKPLKVKREHAVRIAESVGGGLDTEQGLDRMFEACDSKDLADAAVNILDFTTQLRNGGVPMWLVVGIMREVYDE